MAKQWIALASILIVSDIASGMPRSRYPDTTRTPKLNWRTGLYQHGRVKYVKVDEDNMSRGGSTKLTCKDSQMRQVSSCSWTVGMLAMNRTAMMYPNENGDGLLYFNGSTTCLFWTDMYGSSSSNCSFLRLIDNCSVEVMMPPTSQKYFDMLGVFNEDSVEWEIPKVDPYVLQEEVNRFPYDMFRCEIQFADGTNATSDPTSLIPYREADDPSFWEGIGDMFDFGGIKEFFGMGGRERNDTMSEDRNGTTMGALFGDGKVANEVGQTVKKVAISVERIVRSVSGLIDMIQERLENRDRMPQPMNQTEPMMMG